MRRRAAQVLVLLGICVLCFVVTAFAQSSNARNPHPRNPNRVSAPEIDVGSAAGALTIVAGSLTLLRERLRRL